MTLLDFLLLFLVAAICGAVAKTLGGLTRGGLLVALAVGFIGALFGVLLARAVGLPEPLLLEIGDVSFPVVWSIVGGTLFVLVIALIRPYPRW